MKAFIFKRVWFCHSTYHSSVEGCIYGKILKKGLGSWMRSPKKLHVVGKRDTFGKIICKSQLGGKNKNENNFSLC